MIKVSSRIHFFVTCSLVISGCATSKGIDVSHMKIVGTEDLLNVKRNCKSLGRFKGSSEAKTSAIGHTRSLNSLRFAVAKKGGNVVVSNEKYKKGMGVLAPEYTVQGLGFDCPRDVADALTDLGGI